MDNCLENPYVQIILDECKAQDAMTPEEVARSAASMLVMRETIRTNKEDE